jgi:hypothetical protein
VRDLSVVLIVVGGALFELRRWMLAETSGAKG